MGSPPPYPETLGARLHQTLPLLIPRAWERGYIRLSRSLSRGPGSEATSDSPPPYPETLGARLHRALPLLIPRAWERGYIGLSPSLSRGPGSEATLGYPSLSRGPGSEATLGSPPPYPEGLGARLHRALPLLIPRAWERGYIGLSPSLCEDDATILTMTHKVQSQCQVVDIHLGGRVRSCSAGRCHCTLFC